MPDTTGRSPLAERRPPDLIILAIVNLPQIVSHEKGEVPLPAPLFDSFSNPALVVVALVVTTETAPWLLVCELLEGLEHVLRLQLARGKS